MADTTGGKQREETSFGRWLLETILLVLLAVALAMGIRTLVVQPYVIPTESMVPTIEVGNRVLAEKISYRFIRKPQYGDIVVFKDPTGAHAALIKRVIAVGGQTVDVKEGAVYVDGAKLVEPYTHNLPSDPQVVRLPVTIPQGSVWVMGDNRTNSGDSRSFGPVPLNTIEGHAVWTYWPPQAFGSLQ
jgi:signal peptidase I